MFDFLFKNKNKVRQIERENEQKKVYIKSLEQQVNDLKSECDDLNVKLVEFTKNDSNEIRIKVSDDLDEITPIVRYKGEGCTDKLIQRGYIRNRDPMATQVGLMLVAQEGLEQIIESFSESVNDD